MAEDEIVDSITDSMDMNLSKLQETLKDRGAWSAAVHGIVKSQTQRSNETCPSTGNFGALAQYWLLCYRKEQDS